jgi:hypothetical protein
MDATHNVPALAQAGVPKDLSARPNGDMREERASEYAWCVKELIITASSKARMQPVNARDPRQLLRSSLASVLAFVGSGFASRS